MHSKSIWSSTNVVRHQIILLQLVIQVWNAVSEIYLNKGNNFLLNILFVSFLGDEVPLVSLIDVASLSEQTCPQLNSNDPEDEEDEEAEEEDVTKHGQSVQEKHHQYPHT